MQMSTAAATIKKQSFQLTCKPTSGHHCILTYNLRGSTIVNKARKKTLSLAIAIQTLHNVFRAHAFPAAIHRHLQFLQNK